MSALLTDKARRAGLDAVGVTHAGEPFSVEAFLHFHANEGREALVVIVAKVMARDCASYPAWTLFKPQAEAVVTKLVGPLEGTDR